MLREEEGEERGEEEEAVRAAQKKAWGKMDVNTRYDALLAGEGGEGGEGGDMRLQRFVVAMMALTGRGPPCWKEGNCQHNTATKARHVITTELQSTFKAMDADSNGVLTREEFQYEGIV
jgi:hypothetical protein